RGISVIFITHNPHHAYPIGDKFTILKRGRTLGTFTKDDLSRDEMIRLMSGGDELEKLEHELRAFSNDSLIADLVEDIMEEKADEDKYAPLSPEVLQRSAEIEELNERLN